MRLHTHTLSPPKWTGPVPDSYSDSIISLITHDAKGYINVQKSSQSVNHQTGIQTLITTTQPTPWICTRGEGGCWLTHLLYTKQKETFFDFRAEKQIVTNQTKPLLHSLLQKQRQLENRCNYNQSIHICAHWCIFNKFGRTKEFCDGKHHSISRLKSQLDLVFVSVCWQ